MATVPAHIFRAYDIRGIANIDITGECCTLVGKAFGSELRERYSLDHPTIIVGRDARTHSPTLEMALIEGLVSTGCHVQTIGQTPSPVNYFALCHFGADGSIQVTASHNPKEDNGLKLQIRGAEAFAGEELQKVRERIGEDRFAEGEGSVEKIDAITPYLEKIASIPTTSTIVVDFGNGVSGPVYKRALEQAGYEIVPLFEEPDGTFPSHAADPSDHGTLAVLRETVRNKNADCGIAFDGDGDRVGFVDEVGNVVAADYLLLLLAEDHLQRHPEASIVYTVSMSSILATEVQRLGGTPIMCPVGHSFVEHTMQEVGSHLGGEQSGHFFCGEGYYDFDDALVAALRVLSIFAEKKSIRLSSSLSLTSSISSISSFKFSDLFETYPRIFQSPEWRPHCPDESKAGIVARIAEHFQSAGYPCITMDGVRIDFGDGAWAGIRQSNTSPKLSVCMEARNDEKLREIEGMVHAHLGTYPEIDS